MTDDVEHPFVSLFAFHISFFVVEVSVHIFCAFFTELFITIIIEFQEFFLCDGYKAFIRYVIHKYFL